MIKKTKNFKKLFTRTMFFYDFQTGLSFCVAKMNGAHVCALSHFAYCEVYGLRVISMFCSTKNRALN